MRRLDGQPRADRGKHRAAFHQRKQPKATEAAAPQTLVDVDPGEARASERRRSCRRCGTRLNYLNHGLLCGPCMLGVQGVGRA